jgi:hypothetical protein
MTDKDQVLNNDSNQNKNEENEKNKINNNNENVSNNPNSIIIQEEDNPDNIETLKICELSQQEEEKNKNKSEKEVDNEKNNNTINNIKKEMQNVEEIKQSIKTERNSYAKAENEKTSEMDNKRKRLMARMTSSQLLSKKKVKLEKKTSEAILKRLKKFESNSHFSKPDIRKKFNPYSDAVLNKNFGIEDNEILQVTETEVNSQPIVTKKIDFAAFMKK